MTYFVGIAAPGKTLDLVLAGIDAEIAKLLATGVTDAELQKAKNITEAQFVGSRTGMYNKALQLANYHRYYGSTELINKELERYMKVTKTDILRVAKRILENKHRVVLTYLPVKG
jgi:predicted Zn-dependent peptidase